MTKETPEDRSRWNHGLRIMHIVGITVGVMAIFALNKLIPSGAEGGWLTRVYVGFLFILAVLTNATFLLLAIHGKSKTDAAIGIRIVIAMVPILLVLWRLFR